MTDSFFEKWKTVLLNLQKLEEQIKLNPKYAEDDKAALVILRELTKEQVQDEDTGAPISAVR